jgi:hypothetical protein
MGVAVVGNKIVFAGGFLGLTEPNSSAAVDIFDVSNQQWTTATLPVPCDNPAVASIGNQAVFAMGGEGVNPASDLVEIYHADTGTWTESHLPHPVSELSVATSGDKAIFVGGFTTNRHGSAANDVAYAYSTRTGRWRTLRVDSFHNVPAAFTVGQTAIFAGGLTSDGYSKRVDTFSASPSQVSTLRASVTAAVLHSTGAGNPSAPAVLVIGNGSPFSAKAAPADSFLAGDRELFR